MFSHPPGREPTRSPPEDIHDQALRGWSPSPGKLQRLLQMPEYSVFRRAQTFESNFFQVTKDGQFMNIHKHPNVVTIGILASSPKLLLPDLMIIAREKHGITNKKLSFRALEITRLIPLDLVDIFVHDASKRQLKMQLPTGEKHYLQLSAREEKADFLFECWAHLIYLMRLAAGKSRMPENLPGNKPEVNTLRRSSPLQAKLPERPLSREQAQHPAPKLQKGYADKESAKVQSRLQERPSPKWNPEGFAHRASGPTPGADQLKSIRESDLEKRKRYSCKVSSESNPTPVSLQKSQKAICLLQKTEMAPQQRKSPQATRNKDPAAPARASIPGPSRFPGHPSPSQSLKQNQPASRLAQKVNSMIVEAGPSQVVQRKSKVESEKQSMPVHPLHLANQSQNSKNKEHSGNPDMSLGNNPQTFSNISPEKRYLTSQGDTGKQVRKVTLSVGVETSKTVWKTVAVGTSEAIDLNLSKPPHKLSGPNKHHKEKKKAMVMSRKHVPVAKNKLKAAISAAKDKSSLKFVTLYTIVSSSLERLRKSSKDGTKQNTTPRTSKHFTISGVMAKSTKSVALQEEKTDKALGASTTNTLGIVSQKAACVVVKKDFPSSSQPPKSPCTEAIKLEGPLVRETLLKTVEVTKVGHQIAAKEHGVTSITSQAPPKNAGVEQRSVPEERKKKEASKKTLPAPRVAWKPKTVASTPLQPRKKHPLVKFFSLKFSSPSPQSRKAARKT